MQLQRGLAAQRGWERKSLHSVQRSSSSARRLLKPAMVFTGIVQGMAEVRVRVCVCACAWHVLAQLFIVLHNSFSQTGGERGLKG